MQTRDHFLLFAGSSHPVLAGKIAKYLQTELGNVDLKTFPDGELFVQIMDNVRGSDVFVVQTIAGKPNDYLMELLIMIDALKRASARSIAVVIPHYGYSRQDRKDKPRAPITAKLVANLLEKAGATRVLTMDLHAGQVQGFFDIPVDNLYARPSLISAIQKLKLDQIVVVSPDLGSVEMARKFAAAMHAEIALVNKKRITPTEVLKGALIGDVEGKDVCLVDDICSTAGTLAMAAKVCKEHGAKRIIAAVTHGLFSGKAVELLDASPIELMFISDTIPRSNSLEFKRLRIEEVTIADLFGEAINCILGSGSISALYPDA